MASNAQRPRTRGRARAAALATVCAATLSFGGSPGPASAGAATGAGRPVPPPRVVVLPFAESGVPPGTGSLLAESIAAALERGGRVRVLPASEASSRRADLVIHGTVRATPSGRLGAEVVVAVPATRRDRPDPDPGAAGAVLAALGAALGDGLGGAVTLARGPPPSGT